MVLVLDGSSEHVVHASNIIVLSRKKKIGFDDSVNETKYIQQIEIPDLLHIMCATCSELLSNISTMIKSKKNVTM